jgi:HD-GYP domain-containing protein (c-di-GMP phosphodiesterase class II)
VTEISEVIGRSLGLDDKEIEKIRLACILHDLGKIGVSEGILNKNGKLTDEEYDRVKAHPALGERIIDPFVRDKEIRAIVRHHHERFSGGGYPDGLKGKKIPIGARIMSVADAYDAMTSDRPYRKAMKPDKAKSQLLSNRGSQFDPEAVDAFIKSEEKVPFCPMSAKPKKAKA